MSDLAVMTPAGGPPTWGFTRSLFALRGPGDGGFIFTVAEGLAVEQARNLLVERFLASPAQWLLFVDRDALLHPLTAIRLLSWNLPVVAALSFARTEPTAPTVYAGAHPADAEVGGLVGYRINWEETRSWLLAHPELQTNEPMMLADRPDDALTPVDFTGMHCTLIRRDVLERLLPGPWFERVHPIGGKRGAGEDYFFCRRAAEAGFGIYVDRSVQAGHLAGERSIGGLSFLAWDAIVDPVTGRFNVTTL